MCGEQSYQGMESKQLSPPAVGDSGHHAGTDIAMTTAFVVRLSRGYSARKQHQVPLWDGPLEVWPHGKLCCLVLFCAGIPLLLASAGTLRLLHTYDMFILCCFMLYTSPCFCNNQRVLILCLMSGAANGGAAFSILQGSSALSLGHRLCAETQSRCNPSSGGKCILLYQPFTRWCLGKQYLVIFETSWGKPCSMHHNSQEHSQLTAQPNAVFSGVCININKLPFFFFSPTSFFIYAYCFSIQVCDLHVIRTLPQCKENVRHHEVPVPLFSHHYPSPLPLHLPFFLLCFSFLFFFCFCSSSFFFVLSMNHHAQGCWALFCEGAVFLLIMFGFGGNMQKLRILC